MRSTLYRALVLVLLGAGAVRAQVAPPAAAPADTLDFSEFGDADKPAQAYATQKVLYLSPTKLISVGYEGQTGFELRSTGVQVPLSSAVTTVRQRVTRFGGLRLGFNAPVISRSNFILNLGLNYWGTSMRVEGAEASPFVQALTRGLRSTSANATVFKPFDDKHFLLVQANGDLNGNYRGFDDLDAKGITFSGTAVYGWKRNDNFMWGLGVTRTYRAGQLLHIPVVFYNRTFSPRWGVEAVFPARVNLRRSFGTTGLLLLGYELEGNAYYLGAVNGQDLYLRRGEMKPRITYERQLSGFVWLSAQLGYRHNWRFDAFAEQNPKGDNTPVFENRLDNPLYFNLGINLVSP